MIVPSRDVPLVLHMCTCGTLWAVQVWTKLAIGFAATALAIIGPFSWYQLWDEEADLRAIAVRDLRLIGTAVEVAAANALRDGQSADVSEIVQAVQARDPSVDVIVFDGADVITTPEAEAEPAALARRAVMDTRASGRATVRFEGPRGLSYLVGAFPVHADDRRPLGTVALVRALDELRRDLWAETRDTILVGAALVAGLTGAGWWLASAYVRRPVRDLIQAMQAVRAGDLSTRIPFRRADEFGTAVREFNAMTGELIEARQRLMSEIDARRAIEIGLERTDKLVTLGQLSSGFAHEIGSPLQVLNGRARALAARTDTAPDVRRTAEILAHEAERLAGIVERLLAFSRQTTPRIAEAHLLEPVREIVELFELEARRHDVRLAFSCEEPLPSANADVAQVQQVVMNLLTNAVHATPAGGSVRVGLSTGSFDMAGEVYSSVVLTVEDTGRGIPDEVRPHIFEPFFTTRSQAGGTGLGLAVVRSIVDAHGGAIAVTTQAGAGTRILVHLRAAGAGATGGWLA